jgi:hypothetical protein
VAAGGLGSGGDDKKTQNEIIYETDNPMDADHHPYTEWSGNVDIMFE